jgi:hypothetical protein
MKVHGNAEHKQQRVDNKELFQEVRLQSWFQDHRQRYWVVDERPTGDADVGIRAEEEGVSRLVSSAVENVVDTRADGVHDEVEEIVVLDPRHEEVSEGGQGVVTDVLGDDKVIEVVIDDSEEALSDFDDSDDADYEESTPGGCSDNEERGDLSEVEVDESDDEDVTVASDDSEGVGTRDDDIHTGRRGSHPIVVDDASRGGSESMADDDDNANDIGVMWPRGARKRRRVQSTFEDHRGTGIDSEDDTYGPSSPEVSVRGGTKRQRIVSGFVDSGVVMASSQNDDVVPPSSPPPGIGRISPHRSEVEDSMSDTETVVDAEEEARSAGPFEPPFEHQYSGSGRSMLSLLRDRLEKWNRTCPVCFLDDQSGGKRHEITRCVRDDTAEIIDRAHIMQRHIEKFGGFQGRDGCSWCSIPRAVCQRWHIQAGGSWTHMAGQPCQYQGILIPAVITMLVDGCPEGWAVAGNWMSRDGVMQTSPIEAFEWFRQEILWEGIRVARIVRVFHMLVNKNRGVGKA